MKKISLISFLILVSFFCGIAFAQSTALPIVMGYISTSCNGSFSTCWQPYTTSNPMPAGSF